MGKNFSYSTTSKISGESDWENLLDRQSPGGLSHDFLEPWIRSDVVPCRIYQQLAVGRSAWALHNFCQLLQRSVSLARPGIDLSESCPVHWTIYRIARSGNQLDNLSGFKPCLLVAAKPCIRKAEIDQPIRIIRLCS